MAYLNPASAALGDKIGVDEWNQYVVENVKALKALIDTILAPGMVIATAAYAPPAGWLLCYGQAVSRTTYANLYAYLGGNYGSGDGSTTFNLPDLRGRVIAMSDSAGGVASAAGRLTGYANLGLTLGAMLHTLTVPEMPSHSHTYQTGLGAAESRHVTAVGPNAGSGLDGSGTNFIKATGGGGSHNNTQPTLIMQYMIKY